MSRERTHEEWLHLVENWTITELFIVVVVRIYFKIKEKFWWLRKCRCRSYHRATGKHVIDCPRWH